MHGKPLSRTRSAKEAPKPLRVVTYNAHRCIGTDGRLSPQRIAEVIGSCRADIVALQELDVGRARTGGVDQADVIARELDMDMHFHPAMRVGPELYGNAILSTLPLRPVKAGLLPGLRRWPNLEPRGALWSCISADGGSLQVINTHLGLLARERLGQVGALLGPEWLGHGDCQDPVILLGDLNAGPSSPTCRSLAPRFKEARRLAQPSRRQPTFPTRAPLLCIDHVFVSHHIEVLRASAVRTPLARVASDHLPLVVDVQIAGLPEPCAPRDGVAQTAGEEMRRR
jgi:endonuclease/exonuclease/phosphatase family metal-dependent hydrolase